MRKIMLAAALLLALAIGLSACGESRPYTWAIIRLDGETIAEGHLDAWQYHNEFITVEIDGKRYRVSYNNVVLMETPPTTTDQPRTTEAYT